jgi:DNA-binding IclR family transcriptional regulator
MSVSKIDKAGRRRGIQSVEIAIRILEAIASFGTASSLSSIAQATDMAAPQVHRYLQSLIAAGMAQQNHDSGHYDLGPTALKLGLSALARTDAFKVVDRVISAFSERTGQTVQIAALGPIGPTVVRLYMGRPPVVTSLNVGSVLPLLRSATGHVFLAYLSDAETADLAELEARATPVKASALEAIRRSVRQRGFAEEHSTVIPGLSASASPIFDLQGRVILTATLLAPASAVDPKRVRTTELTALCRDISAELGWMGAR